MNKATRFSPDYRIHANRMAAILLSAMLFALHCSSSLALTATVNGITWTYTVSNGKASVGGGNSTLQAVPTSTSGEIAIPSTLGGYTVVGINDYAFYGCSKLMTVTIPASVTSIGDNAFRSCSGLTSMTIPATVTSIGRGVFADCSSLTSISVDASNSRYDSRGNCKAIICTADNTLIAGCKNTTIPNSVTSIGASAFTACSGLTSVTIPDSVTSINSYAFYECTNLTSVTMPNSLTSIEVSAFYKCEGLTSVTIPAGVKSIGNFAFCYCRGLTSVTIPDGVKSIGVSAFGYCGGLTSATIGSGVTSIENSAFGNCTNLSSVTINGKVGTDWSETTPPFRGCTSLRAVDLGSRTTKIGAYMFYGLSSLESITIPDSVTTFGEKAFSGCDNITSARVPQSAMTLGLASVFPDSYQKLSCLTLGAFLANIRDDEFHNFQSLTEFNVDASNTNFSVSADGCLYDAALTTLVACPRNAMAIAIPATVTKIYDYAFDDCVALRGNYFNALYDIVANGGGEPFDPRYALASGATDRAIATVMVNGDSAIDAFVLTDGKVFDTVLRVINTSSIPSTLTLPSGYAYERLKGTAPLTIPALSTNLLTITRTADRVFFVAREELESAQ